MERKEEMVKLSLTSEASLLFLNIVPLAEDDKKNKQKKKLLFATTSLLCGFYTHCN